MANLFGNLLDRDNPAKKLQKEIEGMELKKQTLIAAVQGEIQTARRQKDSELYQIGVAVYDAHINGTAVEDTLAGHYNGIASLEKLIAEKETKMQEIASRYDEEIGMLNTQLGFSPQPQAAMPGMPLPQAFTPGPGVPFQQAQGGSTGAGAFCDKCGAPYTPGEDMFCAGCGNKLA
jgi:hypothetical protein